MDLGWWGRLLLTAVRQMRWEGCARLGSSVPLLCGVGPPCRIRRGCRQSTATGSCAPACTVGAHHTCSSGPMEELQCFPRLHAAQAALPASAARGAGEIVSYKPEHSLALSEVKSRLLDPCFAKRQGRTAHKHYMESQ